jgi:hypothetical protein
MVDYHGETHCPRSSPGSRACEDLALHSSSTSISDQINSSKINNFYDKAVHSINTSPYDSDLLASKINKVLFGYNLFQ